MLEVLLLVIIQSACTNAIVNPWVNPTHRVNPDEYMINGWTPKPTQAPHVPSQLGGMANKGLRRRADIDTCGYSTKSIQSNIRGQRLTFERNS